MALDIDVGFLYAMLKDGNVKKFIESGVTPESMSRPNTSAAIVFIQNYMKKYSALPSMEMVTQYTGVQFHNAPTAEMDYWLEEIRQRGIYGLIQKSLVDVTQLMNRKKPIDALQRIEDLVKTAKKQALSRNRVIKLFSLGDEVVSFYNKVKNGEFGILTPWRTFNSNTLGWHPGDLGIFVARLKTGKTWLVLHMAKAAWHQGKKVLVISAEMSQKSLAMRFYSLLMDLSYGKLRKGLLSQEEEKEFLENVERYKNSDNLYVFGEDFQLNLTELDMAIAELEPDVVYADGMYLLSVPGVPDRFDKAPIIADELKMMAKRYQIPIVGTMQFNRTAVNKKDQELDASMIGLSDQFGWNADVVMGMIRNKEMRESKELFLKTLAIRESEDFELTLNWDFDRMDFSEKIKDTGSVDFKDGGFSDPSYGGGYSFTPYKDDEDNIQENSPIEEVPF